MTRFCLAGSSGLSASTNSPRLPQPGTSTTIGAQPCDALASCVSRYFRVFSQPTALPLGGPQLVHSVLSASWPKYRWWVPKQVSISSNFPVFGSYIDRCRPAAAIGATLAEGWSPPALHQAGWSVAARTRAANQTSPRSSVIRLWLLGWPSQLGSSPQKGDGPRGSSSRLGVPGM